MKKLVIIGGGFAGTTIARKLENEFDATLIDTKDYFEFTPGILRTIVEPNHIKKIQALHKNYLKKTKIEIDCVIEINKEHVLTKRKKKINYDYLVICSGSNYNIPIKEQDVLIGSRAAHLKKAHESLIKSKKILIIGGGLVGVELAAEICTHFKNKKIVLMHSHDTLIPRNNSKTIKYVEKFLISRNVELILGEKMKSVKNKVCLTESGNKIKSDLIFLTAGTRPNFEFMKKNFSGVLDSNGQIIVNKYMQVKEQKSIFAAGDVTSITEEKTAQNAERQAETVVKNIRAFSKDRELVKYISKKTPLVISLGKFDGIFEWRSFVLGGKISALLKFLIEKTAMMKY